MKFLELKFLVNVGVGIKVEKYLLDNGYDIKSIRNINPFLFLLCLSFLLNINI